MKVIKLNRRFKQYKEYGHTVAIKFGRYDTPARHVERTCIALFKSHGWKRSSRWYCYFGKSDKDGYRPYWFTFRNEADVTMLLMTVKFT